MPAQSVSSRPALLVPTALAHSKTLESDGVFAPRRHTGDGGHIAQEVIGVDAVEAELSESMAPEAAAGGPLGRIRSGDYVTLDVPGRRLELEVPADELADREPAPGAVQAYAKPSRGWQSLYVSTVQQANTGADLDFLLGSSGDRVTRDSH